MNEYAERDDDWREVTVPGWAFGYDARVPEDEIVALIMPTLERHVRAALKGERVRPAVGWRRNDAAE